MTAHDHKAVSEALDALEHFAVTSKPTKFAREHACIVRAELSRLHSEVALLRNGIEQERLTAQVELEKLRQRCEELEEENERASALARQIKTDWMPANERLSGELKLAREDARTLAASVHGAFKALGSAPPEPILKVANRHFPLPRKARRTKRAAIDRAGGGEETK
jgi:uncharacterized protein (DUF885 family)